MCALERGGVLEKGTEGIEYGGICDVVGAVGERDDGGLKEIVSEGRRGDVDFIVERVAGGILGESCELFLYVEGVHESGRKRSGEEASSCGGFNRVRVVTPASVTRFCHTVASWTTGAGEK